MHILTLFWNEPCRGNAAFTIDVTEAELGQISGVIEWLEEHAGLDWGGPLPSFELHPTKSQREADLVGLDAVLSEIRLNSRYEETETPGEFYNARNAVLDKPRLCDV